MHYKHCDNEFFVALSHRLGYFMLLKALTIYLLLFNNNSYY